MPQQHEAKTDGAANAGVTANASSAESRIRILPPGEAKRIAAGEVIDRPAALVREFLDNAIDAAAANIDISIDEGGCKKVEVTDDGGGMCREDLELCSLTHATSKIRGLDDLDTALTLGFRGEALAAAAAVARLEIVCSTDGREAWQLEAGPGEDHPPKIEQFRRTKGATVRAVNLFESIPARKRFLKREGSESLLCRQAFIDKALAFPGINFRFIQDGKLRDFFPAVSSKKERFAAAFFQPLHSSKSSPQEAGFLHEINVSGNGFKAAVVIGGPELHRSDRRQLFVFANGRRVNDFSLIQAMEYGAQGWFPNGTHPVGAVYIDIDPSLADFNIHPAKREVRFRDPGAIHHAVTSALRSFFHTKGELPEKDPRGPQTGGSQDTLFENYSQHYGARKLNNNPVPYSPAPVPNLSEIREKFSEINSSVKEIAPAYGKPRYAGRVFNLFILIEWGENLYIIDQHAAHERILYDKFLSQPIPKQELLAPIPFRAESDEDDNFLITKRDELSRLGIEIKKDEDGWQIEALPADWRLGDAATVKEILELRNAGENMAERWAATLSCRAALKDGDYPDDQTAFALGMEALSLPNPRCPHGRPIFTEISREALFRAVRRD